MLKRFGRFKDESPDGAPSVNWRSWLIKGGALSSRQAGQDRGRTSVGWSGLRYHFEGLWAV